MIKNAKARGFLFNEVKVDSPQVSAFDLSYENRLSLNFGQLIPILNKEVIPGDYFEVKADMFARFAPLLAPIMHKCDLYAYAFYTPNRLVWDNWKKYISAGDGKRTMKSQSTFESPEHPYFIMDNIKSGSGTTYWYNHTGESTLLDYLNYNFYTNSNSSSGADVMAETALHDTKKYNALPIRTYNLIYDEYFRDENLQDSVIGTNFNGDGNYWLTNLPVADRIKYFELKFKAWEKDYFTSALPTPQRGADIMLPLGSEASIKRDETSSDPDFVNSLNEKINIWQVADGSKNIAQLRKALGGTPLSAGDIAKINLDNFRVDLSTATSATVQSIRNAFRLQEFLEKSARVGGRYVEMLLAYFGVTSSDATIDRPQYIAGARMPIQVQSTTATAETMINDSPNYQGTQSGNLMLSDSLNFNFKCEEHGFITILVCALPRTSYQQGTPRQNLRGHLDNDIDGSNVGSRFDYAWPQFAHLGEQPVYNFELYNGLETDMDVFGYQSRYAEYKYYPDEVHGKFKSNLDYWHMGRKFSNLPQLNNTFISSSTTFKSNAGYRSFAVDDYKQEHMYLDVWFDIKALRPLPEYGTPMF